MDRNEMIQHIEEHLGSLATTDDAELLFDHLRLFGAIDTDETGYVLDKNIDLVDEYERAVLPAYEPKEFITPQSCRGQIVTCSYGFDIGENVIIERRFDASDRTTTYYAYRVHPDDESAEDWNPYEVPPMLGDEIGRCRIAE